MSTDRLPYTAAMPRLLRVVLTCLLALALTAQGYAAQAMLFCGPAHDPMAPMSAAGHDHAAHGHGAWPAGVAAEATEHGGHEHASMGHDTPPAADVQGHGLARVAGTADGTADGQPSQAKCSACAACCSMTAIASSHALPDAGPLSFAYAVGTVEPHDGRTAGGLERPPRSRLA